ncbi:N-acetylmuramoyl-L-alanine amidase [Streptomyces sp. AJS327]|nr:N-acetylmuramoyl-L-alanine amidase [Streptomyces sp. AJS327]
MGGGAREPAAPAGEFAPTGGFAGYRAPGRAAPPHGPAATPRAVSPGAVLPSAASPTAALPGSTRSLPLTVNAPSPTSPADPPAATGGAREWAAGEAARAGTGAAPEGRRAPAALGLRRASVAPFALLGLVWADRSAPLRGRVLVRTRPAGGGRWSGWQRLEPRGADSPDAGARESRARGATAPLWVGPSDGVEVRVLPAAPGVEPGAGRAQRTRQDGRSGQDGEHVPGQDGRDGQHGRDGRAAAPGGRLALPRGLRLELVNPGSGGTTALGRGAPERPVARGSRASGETPRVPPAFGRAALAVRAPSAATALARTGNGPRAPRPRIVSRRAWGADEGLRRGARPAYTRRVKVAFVHHTATGNRYRCRDTPAFLRALHRYHVRSVKWRDVGYNFLVNRCGAVYEGRAGGVAKPVLGAHTYGFNTNSTGIAVIGSYDRERPPRAALASVARLSAWKLGRSRVPARGAVRLVSAGSGKFGRGESVRFRAVSGHRDAFDTVCPGGRLHGALAGVRAKAAWLQRRR